MPRGNISRIRLEWLDAVGIAAVVAILYGLAAIYWPLALIAAGSAILWALQRLQG